MRNEEYEEAFWEAREVLHRRGKKVGKPQQALNGLRRCPVDEVLLTDHELLKEAWGQALADEILSTGIEADLGLHFCNKCDQMWQEYTEATGRHLKVLYPLAHKRTPRSG